MTPATEKKLGPWMVWFHRRHGQYTEWVTGGEPAVMWLAGLHSPETYLAALVQSAARDKGWALDKTALVTSVTKYRDAKSVGIDVKPRFGCYITGLYLEGAGWDFDACCLKTQDANVLVTELPVVQVTPVEASKTRAGAGSSPSLESTDRTFKAPVYVTQARRNATGHGLVFEADVASKTHSSHWVLQGTALCLNIDQ